MVGIMEKELFKLTMELAQSIRELQKAQAKVEYRNRELLRYIGRRIGCDFENSLRMWECYQKGCSHPAKRTKMDDIKERRIERLLTTTTWTLVVAVCMIVLVVVMLAMR